MIDKVFKFGGASVKDASAVRNLKSILQRYQDEKLLLVISAMGKTTNMIEEILKTVRKSNTAIDYTILEPLYKYHETILNELFTNENHPVYEKVTQLIVDLYLKLQEKELPYDVHYDQTVCYGELLSTTIISHFLNENTIKTELLDAREYIITDSNFRSANPDWAETQSRINKLNNLSESGKLFLTQGFIGSVNSEMTTTLGREGSDFTAAIFAYCLEVKEVVIWKDVPGLLNADPKRFEKTQKINHLSYAEAIELAFYGATIIHPKTMKPLQNKDITLKVQSFLQPDSAPTIIDKMEQQEKYLSSFIVKDNQILVSIMPRDFSFMNEHNLHILFGLLDELKIHVNVLQTSALSLSVCFDEDQQKLNELLNLISKSFKIRYNKGLQLFTIRHYEAGIEDQFTKGRIILLEQRSRTTLQLVLE